MICLNSFLSPLSLVLENHVECLALVVRFLSHENGMKRFLPCLLQDKKHEEGKGRRRDADNKKEWNSKEDEQEKREVTRRKNKELFFLGKKENSFAVFCRNWRDEIEEV